MQSTSNVQFEIAKILGFSRLQIMKIQIMKNIIPANDIRNSFPAIVNENGKPCY